MKDNTVSTEDEKVCYSLIKFWYVGSGDEFPIGGVLEFYVHDNPCVEKIKVFTGEGAIFELVQFYSGIWIEGIWDKNVSEIEIKGDEVIVRSFISNTFQKDQLV